ncbi:hypothetical protein CKA32_001202 [Geitlerinema sp. FC II]|nr:hypothetical protein CKA32_001202 [Geitlerinema sp. FC II]
MAEIRLMGYHRVTHRFYSQQRAVIVGCCDAGAKSWPKSG